MATDDNVKKLQEEQKILRSNTAELKNQKLTEKDIVDIVNKKVSALKEENAIKKESQKISKAIAETREKLKEVENKGNKILEDKKKIYENTLTVINQELKLHKKGDKRYDELIKKRKKEYAKQRKEVGNVRKGIETELKPIKGVLVALENINTLHKEYTKDNILFIKSEKEYDAALEDRLIIQEKILKARKEAKNISDEEYDRLKNEIRGTKNIARVREGLEKKAFYPERKREEYRKRLRSYVPPKEGATPGDKEEAIKFAKQEKFELTKEMGGKLGALRSAKGVGAHIEAAKGIGETVNKFKDLSKILGGVGAEAKGAAGMFGILRTGMEMLGKIGWVGLLITAVTMIAKTINELNKFVKEYNKTFTKIYGPTVALKDVRKSMKEFSDSIFDMNRDLKYAIKPDEIKGLFEAMAAGGMSLAGVGKRITGGYSNAIENAVILSKDFGVSLESMGSMITDQMTNLRASIEDVSKAIEAMSYDATIAGISSEKFYEAVTAATDSLSFYGNYLKSTSALLKTFSESGAMGFKDASKQVQNLMGMFEGMESGKKMAFIQLAGEKNVRDLLKKRADQIKIEEGDIDKRIEAAENALKNEKDANTREALERDISADKEKKRTKERMKMQIEGALEGDVTALQSVMSYIADDSAQLLVDALKGVDPKVNLFDQKNVLIIQKILGNIAGLSEDAVNKLMGSLQSGLGVAEEISNDLDKTFSGMKKETKDTLASISSKYLADIEAGRDVDMDTLRGELEKVQGITEDQIKSFMKAFEENVYVLNESMKGAKLDKETLKVLTTKTFTANLSKTIGAANQQKRLKQLVETTATFEDYLDIGKAGMKYMAAMVDDGKLQETADKAMIQTARSAGNILGWVQKIATGKKVEKTDIEFKESDPKWRLILTNSKKIALYTAKMRRELSAGNTEAAADSQKQIESLQNTNKILAKDHETLLDEAGAIGEEQALPDVKKIVSLEDNIGKLEKEIKDLGNTSEKGVKQAELALAQSKLAAAKEAAFGRYPGALSQIGPEAPAPPGAFERAPGEKKSILGFLKRFLINPNISTADTTPITPKTDKDKLLLTEGIVKGRKGDMLVDTTSWAKGISAGSGQLINKLPDYTNQGGTSVTVPITLQIGNMVGSADELVSKITPAIEQTFTRMFFEKEKRGK